MARSLAGTIGTFAFVVAALLSIASTSTSQDAQPSVELIGNKLRPSSTAGKKRGTATTCVRLLACSMKMAFGFYGRARCGKELYRRRSRRSTQDGVPQ
jgi:hypothetical protein